MKKPINIRPEEDAIGKREKETRIGAVPAVILLLFLAAILSFLFFLRPQVPAAPDGKIEVFINRAMPLPPGTSSTISAFSSCGNFSLFLDGKEIASGGPSMDYTLVPIFTKHILEAKNSRCKASLEVEVLRKECEDGQEMPCAQSGCSGKRSCVNGIFGPCSLPKKICVPGERAGCSTDACRFGYATCNACGDAYGPCLPRENVSSPASCTAENCG